MATIEERIFTVVNGAALASGGVYTDQAPDSALADYIVFTCVGGDAQNTLSSGLSIRNQRYQFDCWSSRRTMADSICEALITLMMAQTGLAANFSALPIGEPQKDFDSDTKLYRTLIDFSLWFYP